MEDVVLKERLLVNVFVCLDSSNEERGVIRERFAVKVFVGLDSSNVEDVQGLMRSG